MPTYEILLGDADRDLFDSPGSDHNTFQLNTGIHHYTIVNIDDVWPLEFETADEARVHLVSYGYWPEAGSIHQATRWIRPYGSSQGMELFHAAIINQKEDTE